MHCTQCGKEIAQNSKFCAFCGAVIPQKEPEQPAQPQDSYFQSTPDAHSEPPAQPQGSYFQSKPDALSEPPAQPQGSYFQSKPDALSEPPAQPQGSYFQSKPDVRQEPPAQSQAPYFQSKPKAQPQAPYSQSSSGAGAPLATNAPKKKAPLAAILIGVVCLAAVAVGAVLFLNRAPALPEAQYTYLNAESEPEISFEVEETIFPSLYRSLDAIVTFIGTNEVGTRDVVIHAEIPGFTQVYEQKVQLSSQIMKIAIHPPLLTGELNLNTEKDAQLVFTVKDSQSGEMLVQESRTIRLMSKYDVVWWTPELLDSNNDNILAWMTPESEGVLEIKREAVDYMSYITDGVANAIVGYQDYGIWDDPTMNTWLQAVAIQGAMSDIAMIRYNNAAFSISSEAQQRVMLPDDVMRSQSGICIETALLMASALQSAGMHPMLVFPPGHAQVAVEAWPGTGEYFLIETTYLPMPMDSDGYWTAVQYLTQDEWFGYLDGTGSYTLGECYVLDCDLGKKLNILPMSN
ncbi:MAG: zinc-ribbon domain-containing protein [Bacillota bacterium]